MTFRHTRFALIAVVGLLLAAAGCGGGESGSASLSREEFITQADQICSDFRTESKATEEAFDAAVKSDDLKTAADLLARNTEEMGIAVQEFANLIPPEEDKEAIDEFVAVSRQQVEVANDLLVAVRAGDETALRSADKTGRSLNAEASRIANSFGMKQCGRMSEAR
jgi:hypothetical protein